jgi:hypothetical protein
MKARPLRGHAKAASESARFAGLVGEYALHDASVAIKQPANYWHAAC